MLLQQGLSCQKVPEDPEGEGITQTRGKVYMRIDMSKSNPPGGHYVHCGHYVRKCNTSSGEHVGAHSFFLTTEGHKEEGRGLHMANKNASLTCLH